MKPPEMTTEHRITIDHVRAAGLCVHGARTWFARHALDFRAFLQQGLDARTLLATGDAMAERVVAFARRQQDQDLSGDPR
jgi:hypothetical protein